MWWQCSVVVTPYSIYDPWLAGITIGRTEALTKKNTVQKQQKIGKIKAMYTFKNKNTVIHLRGGEYIYPFKSWISTLEIKINKLSVQSYFYTCQLQWKIDPKLIMFYRNFCWTTELHDKGGRMWVKGYQPMLHYLQDTLEGKIGCKCWQKGSSTSF